MTAEVLVNVVNNDKIAYDRVLVSVKTLRHELDRTAEAAAQANAEWHDDPEGDPEGHAAYHAPADVQFPRAVRDEAVMELVRYYLAELTIQERR